MADDASSNMTRPLQASCEPPGDLRLYVPRPAGWEVRIMRSGQREYCYSKNPGEEYFHLIVPGEIYLQRGEERYCLNCAYRNGIVTTKRLFWQR